MDNDIAQLVEMVRLSTPRQNLLDGQIDGATIL